jgi:hypothetical protein
MSHISIDFMCLFAKQGQIGLFTYLRGAFWGQGVHTSEFSGRHSARLVSILAAPTG